MTEGQDSDYIVGASTGNPSHLLFLSLSNHQQNGDDGHLPRWLLIRIKQDHMQIAGIYYCSINVFFFFSIKELAHYYEITSATFRTFYT